MDILEFMFPNYTCLNCKGEIQEQAAPGLCVKCAKSLPKISGDIVLLNGEEHECVCLRCGVPVTASTVFCDSCKGRKWSFARSRASFVYTGGVREMILNLKYSAMGDVAKAVAPFMAETFVRHGMEADVIVPVPLCKNRMVARGYNQALLLAIEVGKLLELPVLDGAIIRTKKTAVQKNMSNAKRHENMKNAFGVVDRDAVKGRFVLIVDDVFTSGATVNECAKVLLKAGAERVEVLTIAKAHIQDVAKLKV